MMDSDEEVGSFAEASNQEEYLIEALDEEFAAYDPLTSAIDKENYAPRPCKTKKRKIEIDLGEPSNVQLVLHGLFFKRRFVGETSGSQFASEYITGNSVAEIMQGVWKLVQPVLCREVVFVENNGIQIPTWASDYDPEFSDMSKFIVMQDQAQKRRVTIDKVDSKLVVLWKNKEIRIHVHIYSNAVSSKSLWDMVDKNLIRFQNADRSGAPNNQSVTKLANELQDLHGNHFTGHSSAWRLWANYVHSASPHQREQRMTEMPPNFLLKFFRSAPLSEAVRMETTRSGLSVAATINDGYLSELVELEAEADQLIELGQRVKRRIQGLRSRSNINAGLVGAMSETLRPEENDLSHTLADRIVDMQDVDHE